MTPSAVRRVLLPLLVGVLALGEVATGVVAAADQRADQARHRRAVAEQRAAAAYVEAVRPLSIKVFDAVQPIQDSLDAFAHLRPGLWSAGQDVVTKSGALQEVGAARTALLARRAPATHRAAAAELATALKQLEDAIRELDKAYRAAQKSSDECSTCLAEDHLGQAESAWSYALLKLGASTMPAPSADNGLANGRKAATRGGFIHASDLICAQAQHEVFLLPDLSPDQDVRRNLPKLAKILRTSVASLRKVKLPASRAAVQHRLDTELQSVTSLATTYDRMAAAAKRQDRRAFDAALALVDDQLAALKRLSSTYKGQGVSRCTSFFAVPEDKKASKDGLSA
jgi:hypothetical protein